MANPQDVVTATARAVSQERKVVVIALLGTALIVAADRSFRGSFPKPRVFVALLIVWVFLAFLAEFAPKLAAYFAGLVFVGVLVNNGPFVFAQLQRRINAGRANVTPKGVKK